MNSAGSSGRENSPACVRSTAITQLPFTDAVDHAHTRPVVVGPVW